jgi:hypothetical protein
MRRLLLSPLLLVLAGCPPADLCANVVCKEGKVCEPLNGTCVVGGDAGTDAGTPDGGKSDAGIIECSADCLSMGQECDLAHGTCVQCVDDLPCFAAGQKCDLPSHTCVDCLDDFDCPSCPNRLCINHTCQRAPDDAGVSAPVPGESCAAPANLLYPVCALPRTMEFDVDLSNLNDDVQGTCSLAAGGGHDAVYEIDLDQTYDLTVTVTPLDMTVAPVIYLRADACSGSELACKQGLSNAVTFTVKSRPAGAYFLFLDTVDAASVGKVHVAVTWSAPTQPDNETCETADPLPLDGGSDLDDGGLRAVDLSMASDDDFTSCNPLGGPDVVYSVNLDATSDLLVTATGVGDPGTGISPVVELRSPDCLPAHHSKCRASFQFGPATARLRSAAAGTYFIVVETSGTPGPVVVTAAQLPATLGPPNETCTTAADITFPPDSGTTTFTIDTSDGHDDEHGSCAPFPDGGAPEYVYHLQLLGSRNVVVQAQPDYQVQPVLYLRSGSCESATEVCIGDGGVSQTEVLDAGLLTPGDYWLFVETPLANSGVIHVTVTAAP